MDSKFGVIMVGKVNGETVIVAPFTEGRFSEEERAFSVPKGDPKSDDRKVNANSEFKEETGIDIDLLERNPNHPFRRGNDGNDIFSGARIVQRIEIAPQQYPANSGKETELNLDVVLVDNIAGLLPHLKGRQGEFILAREQAKKQGLPTFEELLATMRQHGLPDTVTTEAEFDTHIENRDNKKALQGGFNAIRADLEEKGLVGDIEGVKFDNKINPLRYFQEGAVIIPVDQYEAEVRNFGNGSTDRKAQGYKASMVGNGDMPGQLDAVLTAISQVQGVMDSVSLEGGGRPFNG